MHRWPRRVALAAVYAGSIVGAGFATGQEIWQFFGVFGSWGRWGVVLASTLLAVLGTLSLQICRRQATADYAAFLDVLLGSRLAVWIDMVVAVFLAMSTGLMLAASRALFQEYLGLPGWLGVLVTGAILVVAVWGRQRSLVAAQSLLVPFLLAVTGAIAVGVLASAEGLSADRMATGSWVGGSWVQAAVLYACYNLVLGIVVLAGLGTDLQPGEEWAGLIGGVMVGFMAFTMEEALRAGAERVAGTAIPMLHLASALHPLWGWLYTLALWAAILTTASATVYALATRLSSRSRLSYQVVCLLIIAGAVLVSQYQFVLLVGTLYPMMGYLGLVLVAAVGVKVWPKRRK